MPRSWSDFSLASTNAHFFAAEFIYRSIVSEMPLSEGPDTLLAKIDSWLPVGLN
jgi:hypothetical protein